MADQQTQTFEDELALIRCLPEINNFRNKRTLTDLSIELQGNVFLHVHKVIIAARIVSLRNSVSGMPRERSALIKWPTISPEVAKPLIEYVYTGQLKVDEAHAAGLVLLSKQLSLPHVEAWVVSFMAAGINAGNIENNWNFARTLQNDQLLNACLEHIKETFETTVASDFFLQLPADTVLSILRADDLKVTNEERVFEAIRLWVSPLGEVDETRVVHAAEMMKEVRWNRVNPDFRYKLLENEGFWDANVECLRLLGRISGWFEGPSVRTGRQCPFNDNRRSAFGDICLVGTSATSSQSALIRYDVVTGTSEQLAILGDRGYAALVAIEDCLFAIGMHAQNGRYTKMNVLDTKELRWSKRASLSKGLKYRAAVSIPVGGEYVIGVFGGYDSYNGYGYQNSCELYSLQENRWYTLPQLQEGRQYAAAVALPDGRVFVIGGQGLSGNSVTSVETCHLREPADWQGKRNTSGSFWSSVAPMSSPRTNHSAVTFKGNIFVAGGTTSNYQSAGTVEVFSPPSNQQQRGQWTTLTDSTLKGSKVALVVWQDRLFSFCSNDQSAYPSVLEFIPPPNSAMQSSPNASSHRPDVSQMDRYNRRQVSRSQQPSNPPVPSDETFGLWTWTSRGTVDALKYLQTTVVLR